MEMTHPLGQMIRQLEIMVQEIAADLARVKKYAYQLEDENARLKEELARVAACGGQPDDASGPPAIQGSQGMDNLLSLYDRGFHVCNLYFGGVRRGDCLFCVTFMQQNRR